MEKIIKTITKVYITHKTKTVSTKKNYNNLITSQYFGYNSDRQ